jgi:transglutaminase-like putative cysteine protease
MIALFRASKIPTRYVHGTIVIDAEQFKNAIGGFSDTYSIRRDT